MKFAYICSVKCYHKKRWALCTGKLYFIMYWMWYWTDMIEITLIFENWTDG